MSTRRGKRVFWLVAVAAAALVAGPAWYHWPRLVLAWRFESLGLNVQGYPEYRHRASGIVFVRLPGGTFEMGSPVDEQGRLPYEVHHTVTLSPFLIAKTEVSQGQWKSVMGTYNTPFRRYSHDGRDDNSPVDFVSWEDSQVFLAIMNGSTPAESPPPEGFCLPTEAQWEYACRAGSTTRYSFGFAVTPEQVSCSASDPIEGPGDRVWNGKPVLVGSLPANAFGLHEMHGNFWEWCEDWFAEDFYERMEATEPNPCNRTNTGLRACRGGAYHESSWWCRSATRCGLLPHTDSPAIGFRPAYYPLPPGL